MTDSSERAVSISTVDGGAIKTAADGTVTVWDGNDVQVAEFNAISPKGDLPAGSMTVNDVTFQVTFEHSTKRFTGNAPGFGEIHGTSWDALADVAKVVVSRNRVRVHVPYVTVRYMGMKTGDREIKFGRGVATGVHAGNGNLLIVDGSGNSKQLDHWSYQSRSAYLQPFEEADGKRYLEVLTEIDRLEAERDVLRKKYEFPGGLKDYVKRQVEHDRVEAMPDGPEKEAARKQVEGRNAPRWADGES